MNASLFAKGNAQIQRQDYTGAIATFTQVIDIAPNHADAFCRRAVAYFEDGNVHTAVSDYGKVLDLDPQHPKAYYGRALVRFTLRNPTGALHDINAAMKWKSDYAAAYQLRAKIYRYQGDCEAAIADFKTAARLYLGEQKAAVAKDCIQSIHQIQDPLQKTRGTQEQTRERGTEQHYFHVQHLLKQGDTYQAMQDINWVLRSDSSDGRAYYYRGIIHLKYGQARAAIADFNQAIALNFSETMVYHNRGKARLQLGDYHGAIQDCNQSLSIEKTAEAYIIRGNATRMKKDETRAIKDYDLALTLTADCGDAHYERGLTYERLGKFQEAASDYQQAIRLFGLQEEWTQQKAAQARLELAHKAIEGTENNLARY